MHLKTPFFIQMSFLLLISFFILLWVFPVGGSIDLYLIQPWVGTFGDFALKGDWYLAKLNHSYVKQIITVVYVTFLFYGHCLLKSKNSKRNVGNMAICFGSACYVLVSLAL